MSEMSHEQIDQYLDESSCNIRNGEIKEGTVIDVKEDQIILNIGYKADGILTKQEYSNDSSVVLTDEVKLGDKLTVKVLKVNDGEGQVLLSYKRLQADRGIKILEEAFNNGDILTGKVIQAVYAGLTVSVEGARVFIPASLVSDVFERDLKKYIDQEVSFKLIEFDPRKKRIIGDRKQIVAEEKAKLQEELFERIGIGDVVEGTVKNVTDFGVFIDLGGADGLLHISEMSWGRVDNPKSLFKAGDKVKVLIKDIKGSKIALSRKFEDENPWINAAEKYAAGTIVEGKVARMTDFGAFIELEPGIDALLHVSQISRTRVEKPSDVLSVGDIITVKIVDFNEADRKISLSKKACEPKDAPAPEAPAAEEETAEVCPVEEAAAEEAAEAVIEDTPDQGPVEKALEKAGDAVEAAGEKTGEAFGAAGEKTGEALGKAGEVIDDIVDAVKENGGDVVAAVKDKVGDAFETVKDKVEGVVDKIKEGIE
jgi:ribosomal protein S1